MNNRKVQANMQINVGFVADTTKLVKEVSNDFKKIDLGSSLFGGVSSSLDKNLKTIEVNLNKMFSSLGKRGLTTKQYENMFHGLHDNIVRAKNEIQSLGEEMTKAFKGEQNKKLLADLKEQQKVLEEIQKLYSKQKGANTRKDTNAKKALENYGVDFNNAGVRGMLDKIIERRGLGDKTLTPKQQASIFGSLNEADLKKVITLYDQFNQQKKISIDYEKQIQAISGLDGSSNKIIQAIQGRITELDKETISQEELNEALKEFNRLYQTLEGGLSGLEKSFNTSLGVGMHNAESMAEGLQTINDILRQFGIRAITIGTAAKAFKDLAMEAFNFYKSLDSALNQIYIVSNLTSRAVDELKTNFISMSKETGMALDDVTRAAVLFYQQGLSTDDVMIMTEVTAQFAKVAGIDATDAADKLTAAVNGYCLAAEDAASVADKFNKVAAVSAADIDELSTAFSKAAAQANQAGVSMDNYLAYIATMEEATREAPENLGTSLKTIFSRMQQVNSGEAEDGTDINKVETALKTVNIELRDMNGQLRDLEDVFAELGPKWQSLDRNTQAYLGTIIAGTRQQSRFITLMQNWDRVLELSEESANSAGQQALMHAKAMESIESKMQQLQVAWQEFTSNIAESSFFKGIIELLTTFVKVINSGNKPLLLLATGFTFLTGILTKLTGPLTKLLTDLKTMFTRMKNIQANLGNAKAYVNLSKTYKTLSKDVKDYGKQLKELQKQEKDLEQQKTEYIQKAAKASTPEEAAQYKERLKETREALKGVKNEIEGVSERSKQAESDLEDTGEKMTMFAEGYNETITAMKSTLQTAMVGFTMLASLTSGTTSDMFTLASAIMIVGQAAVAATEAIQATENASVILLAIKAVLLVIIGLVTAVKSVISIAKGHAKEIAESAENAANALNELNNRQTALKSAERLLKTYDELSKKVLLTNEEQAKLNDTAQQLADMLEIEPITDKYGNLSLAIDDVNEKMAEMEAKAEDARNALRETELEEIEKYDWYEEVGDFYEKYLKSHRSELRGATTGLLSTELAEDAKEAEKISERLKDAIIDDSMEMAEAFGGLGIHWTMTDQIESLMNSFNSADISNSQWEDLYQTIDVLRENLDTLSYDRALEVIEDAIQSWGKAAGLTTEQLKVMKTAIVDSLYGDSALNSKMQKYQEITARQSSDYYSSWKESYQANMDRAERESTTFNNGFEEDEYEKEYEYNEKKLKLMKEEEESYKHFLEYEDAIEAMEKEGIKNRWLYNLYMRWRNNLAEEYGFHSKEEVEKAEKMEKILGRMNQSTSDILSNAGLLDEDFEDVLQQWEDEGILEKIISQFSVSTEEGTRYLTSVLIEMIKNTDDEEMRQVLEEKLEKVINGIQVSGRMTWKGLHDGLDSVSEDLRNMNKLLSDFNETGAFTLETFADLCDMLDSMDIEDIFNAGQLDAFLVALDTLQLGFDESTGMITANGAALQTLGQIQAEITREKLKQMKASLEADKAELQSTIYGIEAEIAANEALIQELVDQGKVSVSVDELKEIGQKKYNNTMQQAATLSEGLYRDMVSQSNVWATAAVKNAAIVGDAIKKALAGQLGTANVHEYLGQLVSGLEYEKTGSYNELLLLDRDEEGNIKVDDIKKALENYNAKGLQTIKDLRAKMKGIENMQGLLDQMISADLSKLGSENGKGSIDKYIGQLKEIYNILNRIQVLEHRLSMLDEYADVARGEQYGQLLQERLSYNEELLHQYQFLTEERKKQANGYKEFIESIEGLEGVFEFDKYGQMIINYEKYLQLQDEAIDGETTMMEKADDVYNTYNDIFKEVQDYLSKTIDYYKEVIELGQEMVDSYISLQNKAADAVKEIYQEILDTKLDAIDQEKEAIEELRDARERANKEQKDAKEVAGIQSDIQRAMMDTSGASASALIKSQANLDEKLNAIAEDKYSEMLDDIIKRLDEEQQSLQQEFDDMFDDLNWLFTMLDEDVMNDLGTLNTILNQTQAWRQESRLEQMKEEQEREKSFYTYFDKVLDGEKGIYNIFNKINETRDNIKSLDEGAITNISSRTAEIGQTLLSWKNANSPVTVTNASAFGGSSNYYDNYTPTITGTKTELKDTTDTKVKGIQVNADSSYQSYVGRKNVVEVRADSGKKIQLYNDDGSKYKTVNDAWAYDPNVIITAVGKKGSDYYAKISGWSSVPGDKWISIKDLQETGSWGKSNYSLLKNRVFAGGGFADFTGPAWLDGSKAAPEAVLDNLQTKHFIQFTNALDKMFMQPGGISNSSVTIDNISFNVESMSSPEDGEKAFNMFVSKFNEIGNQTGIKFNNFKNTL